MGWDDILDEGVIRDKKGIIEYSVKIKNLIKGHTKLLGHLIKKEDKISTEFLKHILFELEEKGFKINLDEKLKKMSASNSKGSITVSFIREEDFNQSNNYYRNQSIKYMQEACSETIHTRGATKLRGYFKVNMNFEQVTTFYVCLAASYPLEEQFLSGGDEPYTNVCEQISIECLKKEGYYPTRLYLQKLYLGGCFEWLLDIEDQLTCIRKDFSTSEEYYGREYNRLLRNVNLQEEFVANMALSNIRIGLFKLFEEANKLGRSEGIEKLGIYHCVNEFLDGLVNQ